MTQMALRRVSISFTLTVVSAARAPWGNVMKKIWLAPVYLLLAAHPASARPRDDTMAGAYRCAVVADSRAWLDCYYGAAQPMRGTLGLQGAPVNQIRLAALPPAGGTPQDESIRDDVMAAATACVHAPGDRAWLDCYYGAALPMRARLGLAVPVVHALPPRPVVSRPALAIQPVPAGPPPMPRSPGLFNGMFNNVNPVVRKIAMQSYTLDRKGAFTVTLADGQVWVQAAEDEVYHPAHWRHAGPDVLVTIAPDAMHTFTMMVEGEQRFYKVRRIH
jgi:hypothetical protein